MKIKKPELTERDKKLGNEIHRILMAHDRPITKEFICQSLGWEYNSSTERKVRDLLSKIAKVKPLISTSDQKGYYIARKVEDLEAVTHCWKEIDSRIAELEERRKPLIDFYEKCKKL